jgi:hypothetical protein
MVAPKSTEGFFVDFDPYTFIKAFNVNPATANGYTMAVHVDLPNPVPEPSTLTLLSVVAGAACARSWRQRKRPAAV